MCVKMEGQKRHSGEARALGTVKTGLEFLPSAFCVPRSLYAKYNNNSVDFKIRID
jgi:hypothetical protein